MARMWEEMPDLAELPSPDERKLYFGDICKHQGKAWVWIDGAWHEANKMERQRYVVQVKLL